MKNLKNLFFYFIILLVGYSFASNATVLEEIAAHEKGYRTAVKCTISSRLAKLREIGQGIDRNSFYETALTDLNTDIKRSCQFHRILKKKEGNFPTFYENFSFPLRFNKVHIISRRVLQFLANRENFNTLLSGKLPEGYEYDQNTVPLLSKEVANNATVWGNERMTTLLGALFAIESTHTRKIPSPEDVQSSPILHRVPFPKGFRDALFEQFPDFSTWRYITDFGLLTLHHFYAFGGHRQTANCPRIVKHYAPEDCSSLVAKMTGFTSYDPAHYEFTTADLLFAARIQNKQKDDLPLEEDEKKWLSSGSSTNLLAYFSAKNLQNITEITKGMIYTHLSFNSSERRYSDRAGGHMGLVFDIAENNDLVIFNCNRFLPLLPWETANRDGLADLFTQEGVGGYDTGTGHNMDGFGLSVIPYAHYWEAAQQSDATKETLFFSVKD
jgi:hypothetical protein